MNQCQPLAESIDVKIIFYEKKRDGGPCLKYQKIKGEARMAHLWRKEYKDRSRILDKFYTKQAVVKRCLDEVNKLPYIYDCVIEPSAGDGAFYKKYRT